MNNNQLTIIGIILLIIVLIILKVIENWRKAHPKIEKDPNDFTLTASSTDWIADNHYCTKCKCSCSHREFMSNICNNCGSFKTIASYARVYRKIYIDKQWKYQLKYKDFDKFEILTKVTHLNIHYP